PDDLATLTNRGTVKRAQKEVEAGEPRATIEEEPGGRVVVRWSDGIVCEFRAGGTIRDANCSSNSPGISRHVVRSVLFYQRHHSRPSERDEATPSDVLHGETKRSESAQSGTPHSEAAQLEAAQNEAAQNEAAREKAEKDSAAGRATVKEETASGVAAATPSAGPVSLGNAPPAKNASATTARLQSWDPGQFTDEQLTACYGAAAVARARARFAQGVLVEVTRGAKPTARFLDESSIVRFLVPNDLRYASADCSESQWGLWVSMAVWSFRRLAAEETAGMLSLQLQAVEVPRDTLDQWQTLLQELCRDGFAGVAPTWCQRMTRLHGRLEADGLAWPAELAGELQQIVEQYQAHDARFDPEHAVAVIGESLARTRAIARGSEAVPQLLVRGGKTDRASEIRGSRFIGVGLGAAISRRNVTLSAFVQDVNSGHVGVIERVFANPAQGSSEAPRSLVTLAATTIARGVSLGAIGMSQLILQAGKRTANDRLIPPRGSSGLTVNPQTFQWEQLRPPLAVEGLAQLRARLRFLPPSYLRPRRATEGLFCVELAGCDGVAFDGARQQLEATLRDRDGETARLIHPYFDRAADGFQSLSRTLHEAGERLRFVCGHAKLDGRGLSIRPVAVVFDDQGRRTGVCPWFSRGSPAADRAVAADSVASTDSVAGAAHESNSSAKLGASDDEAGECAEVAMDASPPSSTSLVDEIDGGDRVCAEFIAAWRETLGDLLVTGLVRAPRDSCDAVRRLADRSGRIGFVRVAHALQELSGELDRRDLELRWDAGRAAAMVAHHCLLATVAVESC
ncbi:MAG TPA: hypothetical protein PLV92_07260, partial [Pirellulaceae bacterium]|nr:hypothetical protein [Pirellulaceae bacterium]